MFSVAATSSAVCVGFADVDTQLRSSLLEPSDPDAIAAFLERRAGREALRAPEPGARLFSP